MVEAHGGKLVNLQISESELKTITGNSTKKVVINNRNISDCEMLGIGAFSPLTGFMHKDEVQSVLDKMELSNGLIWSIPIVLNVSNSDFEDISVGEKVILINQGDEEIAILEVAEKYTLDLDYYCSKIFLTTDKQHPGVQMTYSFGNTFLAGKIKLINKIHNEKIADSYFLDPKETRQMFKDKNWDSIVAFQTRNPIHRAHEYIVKCALENHDGLIIHPIVGETKSDDIPADIRMECYEVLLNNYFNRSKTILSVMPAAMRYAGPREAIHHLIIRQNYGCTHMIIGRDHAGVGSYYGTYDAQLLVKKIKHKLLIQPIFFENSAYCKKCEYVVTSKTCSHDESDHITLSGTKVREMLKQGNRPPEEFSRKEISEILIRWAQKAN